MQKQSNISQDITDLTTFTPKNNPNQQQISTYSQVTAHFTANNGPTTLKPTHFNQHALPKQLHT
jgi:hypothetical protein